MQSLGRGDLVTNSFLAHLSAVKPSYKKSSKMTTPTVLVAIDRSMWWMEGEELRRPEQRGSYLYI